MSDKQTTALSFPRPDIAVITLDNPERGANILSQGTLLEIEQHLDDLDRRWQENADSIRGLIFISAKPGMFIAGADLSEFVASMDATSGSATDTPEKSTMSVKAEAMCYRGQNLFRRFSTANYVTVAAIDGICVGGGTELSLWCDRRLISSHPKSEIGLPEVKIGLMPGWGGSVRLPRLVGLSNTIEIITSGDSVKPHDALQMGLVSNVVDAAGLLESALHLVMVESSRKGYLQDRERWQQPINMSAMELAFLKATATSMIAQQTLGNYPAPLVALESMLASHHQSIEQACVTEAKGLVSLFGGEVNRGLLNIFFLTDRNKKDQAGLGHIQVVGLPSVGVIGAGIMGSGIAAAHLKRQLSVALFDSAPAALERGVRTTLDEVAFDRVTKSASPTKLLEFAPLLRAAADLSELSKCDLVIEAVVEKADVKQRLFAELESHLRPDAILASNTSTIPISQLAQGLKHPERFCGIHFFNPVRRMMLVEIIRGPQTSDQTIATALAHVKKLGKYPVVVQDGPGFLVNRLLFPYMNEALVLLSEGVSIEAIDRAAKKFGMPMGPLELHDMVGLDTALFAGGVMNQALPGRMPQSPILPALVAAGRLGNKSGAGFYSYNNKKGKRLVDPQIDTILKPHLKSSDQSSNHASSEELIDRLMMPMLLEATEVLASGLVRDARDVDLGMIFGIGFPAFRGGLLFWADRLGLKQVMHTLQRLESLGDRFKPNDYLLDLAKRGQSFYQSTPTASAV